MDIKRQIIKVSSTTIFAGIFEVYFAPQICLLEMNSIIQFQLSNLSKAKARVVFAIQNKDVAWEYVIFVGIKKIKGVYLMCAISQSGYSTLRLEFGTLRRQQYISFFNEVVLPFHDRDNNCIFMQVSY